MSENILRNSSVETGDNILRNDILRMPLSSDDKDNIFRALTPGEIELAESIFQDTIKYNKIKIYRGGCQSGLQPKVMTQPRSGGVILTINEYRDDFSTNYDNYHDSLKSSRLFIFAMSFIWQYYRYDSSFCDAYTSFKPCQYNLKEPSFNFYTMEQQASIIADYWSLNKYGRQEYKKLTERQDYDESKLNMKMDVLMEYQNILRMFVQYIK